MNNDDLNESLSEVEAVMRLLEEKERDLELAARIGQTLLADNRKLKVCVGYFWGCINIIGMIL